MASNPLHLSLFELYTAFRSGNMTAGDLTEQAIEQHNTALGAYKYWQPQDAATQLPGQMHHFPLEKTMDFSRAYPYQSKTFTTTTAYRPSLGHRFPFRTA